jgi:hypothetical protein
MRCEVIHPHSALVNDISRFSLNHARATIYLCVVFAASGNDQIPYEKIYDVLIRKSRIMMGDSLS